jgi:proteic killer suppression protein
VFPAGRLTDLIQPLPIITRRVIIALIKTFADKQTERIFRREPLRRYPAGLYRVMLRRLLAIDAAEGLDDLRVPPGNRLEKLKGKRAGEYSIRVNGQWRICFRWKGSDAYDVMIVDYH